jgi:hypothetical protein
VQQQHKALYRSFFLSGTEHSRGGSVIVGCVTVDVICRMVCSSAGVGTVEWTAVSIIMQWCGFESVCRVCDCVHCSAERSVLGL